jgi:hypothetical protein
MIWGAEDAPRDSANYCWMCRGEHYGICPLLIKAAPTFEQLVERGEVCGQCLGHDIKRVRVACLPMFECARCHLHWFDHTTMAAEP